MRGIGGRGIVVAVCLATGCAFEGAPPDPDPECPEATRTAFADEVIIEDETWVRWCGPYTVEGVLRVEQAATLRVEAGVQVRLGPGARIVIGETTRGALEALGQPESRDGAGRIIRERAPVSFSAGSEEPWDALIVAIHGSALLREVEVRGAAGAAAVAVQGGSLGVDGANFTSLTGSALSALTRYLAPPRPADPPEWGAGALQVNSLTADSSGAAAALRLHWSHVNALGKMLDLPSGRHIALSRRSDEVIGSLTFLRQRVPYRLGSGWGPASGEVWTLHGGVTLEVEGGLAGHLDVRYGHLKAHGLPGLPVELRSPSGEKGSWRGLVFTWSHLEYQNLIVTGGGAAWHAPALGTGAYHAPDNHASLVAWGATGPPPPGLSSELLVRNGRGFLGIHACFNLPFARGGARLENVDDARVVDARYCG
jgi:hypothetical protein